MSKAKARRKALKANNARRSAQTRGKVSLPQWDHGAMGQANRVNMVVEERADVDPETGKKVNPKPDMAVAIQIDRISRFEVMMRGVRDADRQIVRACVLDGRHPSQLPQYQGDKSRDGFAHLRAALDYLSDRI